MLPSSKRKKTYCMHRWSWWASINPVDLDVRLWAKCIVGHFTDEIFRNDNYYDTKSCCRRCFECKTKWTSAFWNSPLMYLFFISVTVLVHIMFCHKFCVQVCGWCRINVFCCLRLQFRFWAVSFVCAHVVRVWFMLCILAIYGRIQR